MQQKKQFTGTLKKVNAKKSMMHRVPSDINHDSSKYQEIAHGVNELVFIHCPKSFPRYSFYQTNAGTPGAVF